MRLFHRSKSRTSGTANLAELRRKSSRVRRGGGCTAAIFTDAPRPTVKLVFPECCAANEVGGAPPEGVCATVSDALAVADALREARPRGSGARPRFRTSENEVGETQENLCLESFLFSSVLKWDEKINNFESRTDVNVQTWCARLIYRSMDYVQFQYVPYILQCCIQVCTYFKYMFFFLYTIKWIN